jgi:N utilization substance protein B
MTRTTAREIAVLLGFSAAATGQDDVSEFLDRFFDRAYYETLRAENELFAEYPDERQMAYIRTLTSLICAHRAEMDAAIESYAQGWKLSRISRMAAAILRCAMCEIRYLPDVPDAAAINEAVELAKKYEEAETVPFINGILGAFVRGSADGAGAE